MYKEVDVPEEEGHGDRAETEVGQALPEVRTKVNSHFLCYIGLRLGLLTRQAAVNTQATEDEALEGLLGVYKSARSEVIISTSCGRSTFVADTVYSSGSAWDWKPKRFRSLPRARL